MPFLNVANPMFWVWRCSIVMFIGLLIFNAEPVFYPLGLLLKVEEGVFLAYSSFNGANFEDFILFDCELIIFWTPFPIIVIGKGWKSNCLIDNKTSEIKVLLELGKNDISIIMVYIEEISPFKGVMMISWHYLL